MEGSLLGDVLRHLREFVVMFFPSWVTPARMGVLFWGIRRRRFVSPARVCSDCLFFLGGSLGAGTGPVGERGSWQQCAAVPRHSLDRLNTSNDS